MYVLRQNSELQSKRFFSIDLFLLLFVIMRVILNHFRFNSFVFFLFVTTMFFILLINLSVNFFITVIFDK